MSLENLYQTLCDSTGLIIDRTQTPEQVLGQVCMISKARAVTAASGLFNYTEAPWALMVRFPFPGIEVGVKVVTLNPNFDKRQARLNYLAQTGAHGEYKSLSENDIAIVTLEENKVELRGEQVEELNKALSLPLSVASTDISGNMTGADIPQIVRKALAYGKEGLLTMYDSRNFAFARVAVRPGQIQKVIYSGLFGEMGLFELLYRKPPGTFVFQPPGSFEWPEMRDISTPPETLGNEGMRRARELPGTIEGLGGLEARFQHSAAQYDPTAISPSLQWVAERLWAALDGFVTIDQLWQRIGADTYTICIAIQEFLNQGLIAPVEKNPFHLNGQLGPPVVPTQNTDISVGHPLSGFYLDPLSGRPYQLSGSFYGVTRVQAPNSLLHTVPFPPQVSAGLVFSEDHLVGVNTGEFHAPEGQNVPQDRLYQMTFIGALNDMGAKRLKSVTATLDAPDDLKPDIREPMREPLGPGEKEGPPGLEPAVPGKPNKKMIMIGSISLLVVALMFMVFGGKKSDQPVPQSSTTEEKPAEDPLAEVKKTAVKFGGLKKEPPHSYEYVDTSEETPGQMSFGLNSERQNQKLLFLVWDNTGPVDDLELIMKRVPYTNFVGFPKVLDEGQHVIGGGPFKWKAARFKLEGKKAEEPRELALIGAYNSPVKGKAIVIIARPYSEEDTKLDYNTTVSVIDTMAADYSARAVEQAREGAKPGAARDDDKAPLASIEDITAYVNSIQPLIQAKFKPLLESSDSEEDSDEDTELELKAKVIFTIKRDGSIGKLELRAQSFNERYDQALFKAVQRVKPYPKPPRTEDNELTVIATAAGADIKLQAQ